MKKYNSLPLRILALALHLLINVWMLTWLVDFDVSGKWITFIPFVAAFTFITIAFIYHLILFTRFLKSKSC